LSEPTGRNRFSSTTEQSYTFQYYCTAVIDVLGQSNRLEYLNDLPKDNEARAAYTIAASETVGAVLNVRNHIDQFFSTWMSREPSARVQSLAPEMQGEFKKLQKVSLTIQQFSDTIVSYSSVRNEADEVSLSSVSEAAFERSPPG